MTGFAKIAEAVDTISETFDVFKTAQGKDIAALRSENTALQERVEELETRASMPGKAGGPPVLVREKKALERYARSGNALEFKDMSITGGAAAGQALVPEFIQNEIISRAIARSRLTAAVRRTPTDTSDYVRLLNLRGQAAGWISETGTRSGTASLLLREIRPTHGELYSVVTVTNWLLNDAKFNISELIIENAVDQFSKSLELATVSGNGTNQLTGLLNTAPVSTADNASPLRAADALQFVNSGAGAITADSIYDVFFTLKPEYRARAQWLMSSLTLSAVRKLKASTGGDFLWQTGLGPAVDANDGLLAGKSIMTSENMPAIGTGTFPVMVGDFNAGYEIVEIGGMTILRDQISVKGKSLFYISQRFGGRTIDNDALKVLKTT
jgi:HK97 family phage major capsid protein